MSPPTSFIHVVTNDNSPNQDYEPLGGQVFWTNWPEKLPEYGMLHHLYDSLFTLSYFVG